MESRPLTLPPPLNLATIFPGHPAVKLVNFNPRMQITTPPHTCPDCGAAWQQGLTCQDHFHQMLFWEAEDPTLGEVHHLMVLGYHLQHPGLYSPQGLEHAMDLLVAFLEKGQHPQQVRQGMRGAVDSGARVWTVTARPDSQGAYPYPLRWGMTADQVVAGGPQAYCRNVRAWAQSILDTLKESGNLI